MDRALFCGERCICCRSILTAKAISQSSTSRKQMTIGLFGWSATIRTILRRIFPSIPSKLLLSLKRAFGSTRWVRARRLAHFWLTFLHPYPVRHTHSGLCVPVRRVCHVIKGVLYRLFHANSIVIMCVTILYEANFYTNLSS